MATYVHALDVCFNVRSDKESIEDISKDEIIAALEERVAYLKANPQEGADAFGHVETYEED